MQIDFAPKTKKAEPGRWDRADFVANDRWRVSIPPTVLEEFLIASAALSTSGTNWLNYRPGLIRLPELEVLGKLLQTELLYGTGVTLLRGLNPELLGEEQARLFLVLLSTHFAEIIDSYGRLYDVIDRGLSYKENAVPVSQTNAATTFHTDSSALNTMPDMVGMLCLRQAKSGGESLFRNVVDVHEKMRRARPDLLAKLYEDYVRDIVTPGTERTYENLWANRIPIFSYRRFSEALSFRYMRYWIETGHQKAGLPLDSESMKALDYLDSLLEDAEQVVEFFLKPGDILLINNHTIAHNRRDYEDYEEPSKHRLMVRIWLKSRSRH